jgi:hypothetical protein
MTLRSYHRSYSTVVLKSSLKLEREYRCWDRFLRVNAPIKGKGVAWVVLNDLGWDAMRLACEDSDVTALARFLCVFDGVDPEVSCVFYSDKHKDMVNYGSIWWLYIPQAIADLS